MVPFFKTKLRATFERKDLYTNFLPGTRIEGAKELAICTQVQLRQDIQAA